MASCEFPEAAKSKSRSPGVLEISNHEPTSARVRPSPLDGNAMLRVVSFNAWFVSNAVIVPDKFRRDAIG